MKLQKRGLIKLGFIGLATLASFLIISVIFSSVFTKAGLDKENYNLGEKVKINLRDISTIKISAPTKSYISKNVNGNFIFEPTETGNYEISIENSAGIERYKFSVINPVKEIKETIKNSKKIESTLDFNEFIGESQNLDKKISLYRLADNEKEDIYPDSSSRSLKPGIYNITVNNITKEFAYGLISINTKKSIYSPGDQANLEIVVLDSLGSSVCNAEIVLGITDPTGEISQFSSEEGIENTDECGVYSLNYNTSIEGEYFVNTSTLVDGYDVAFSTSFLVSKDYDYDIIRDTKSKIDPTLQEWFEVKIYVNSLKDEKNLEIKEYVPESFNLTIKDDAQVETVNGTKIIKWNVKETKAELSYSYSVPHVWPYLYELGPLDVNSFKEFRPWYVAVDPIVNITGVSSLDVDVSAFGNNSYVVAWIQQSPLSLQFKVFDTNGTNKTSNVTVTQALDADSRVSVAAINNTNFIVAWSDGDAASEDGNARGYLINGTPWFNQFEFESGIGTTAVDINVIPMFDRYQICYMDAAEADADIHTYLYATPTTLSGVEKNLDTAANPDTSQHNLFECAAMNSTRFAAFWFDDSGDTASYSILANDRTSITAQTNIDNLGTTGQASTTALNRNSFAMAYYDSVQQSIKTAIRSVNNVQILGVTTLDSAAGSASRVATATVRNRTANDDWYVVAWNDINASAINASVLNSSGSIKYEYTLVNDENVSSLLFDIYGSDTLRQEGICDESYVLAYTANNGSIYTKTFNLDGTDWFGICDFTPPNITVRSPLNITYNTSIILFNITLDDIGSHAFYTLDNGVNNVSMTNLNNLTWQSTNSSIADGDYPVRFYVNNTNNLLNSSVTVNFAIDTTPPIITVNSPALNHTNYSVSNVFFNISLSEAGMTCFYTLNNGINNFSMSSTNNLTWNATNSSIGNGLFTSKFYCNDSVNNIGQNSSSFRIDTVAPSVNIIVPAIANYTNNLIGLNFSVVDAGVGLNTCWYTIDNGDTNNTISNCQNTSFTAQQGYTTLYFYANDSLGNLNNTRNVTFFVDSVNPLITFVAPTPLNDSGLEFTSFLVNVSITETNFANITFELYNVSGGTNFLANRTTYTDFNTSINFTGLNNTYQNYTYNVTVKDILGNTNYTETRTIRLTPGDINPPNIFFDNPLTNNYFYNSSSISLQVTLSEPGSTVIFRLNDSLFNYSMSSINNLTWNYTNSSISDGSYEIIIYANDTAGNTAYRTRNFTVDTVSPLISYGIGTQNDGVNLSSNFVYVNVSVTELNEQVINFTLYDSGGVYNSTTYTNFQRAINWSDLVNGDYYYNVTIKDKAGNFNSTSTRHIRLDTVNPRVALMTPSNGSYVNVLAQNLTVNLTDNFALSNATMNIYNSTSSLINSTTVVNYKNYSIFGINYSFPYDGNFTWFYSVRDGANNFNLSLNYSIVVDSTRPLISYISPTFSNGSINETDSIYINVSVTELNFANITFELYNNTNTQTLVNRTTFNDSIRELNITNLSSLNVTYYYNVTVRDLANNINFTDTRTVKLVDITPPSLTLTEPANRTYYTNMSLSLSFTANDDHLASCWYNVDQVSNITLPNCADTTFNVSQGTHTFYLYANDSLGLMSSTSVGFTANNSLYVPYQAILSYGEGAVQTPRYRIWNGTGFSSELTSNSVGGKIEWLRAKTSPTRDENIVVTSDVLDDINIEINGTLSNGSSCWNNGTFCGATREVETTSTTVNRLKVDVAYETKGDDAIIVWSQGNSTPGYIVWNGTDFGSEGVVPQTLITSGDISFVKMASHPFRDEIALIMTNTTALNIMIWNGTAWGCQPSSLPSPSLTPDVFQHADVAYEQVSGDLFVAGSVDVQTEIDYIIKSDGSCSYTSVRTTTMLEEGELISIASQYASNYIMVTQYDITGSDMHSIVWDGTQMLATSGNEASLYPAQSPSELISAAWAGTSNHGLVIYSDAANSLVVDYFRYNKSTNAWEDNAAAGFDAGGLTNFANEELDIASYSYIDQNRTLLIVHDDNDQLWAKAYDSPTNTWLQPDGGTALETGLSNDTIPAFGLDFNYDRFGPQMEVVRPLEGTYLNSSAFLINVSLKETGSTCTYVIDSGTQTVMNSSTTKSYFANPSGISDGSHTVTFNCSDIRDNYRTISASFTVDTTNPLLNFTGATESNNSAVERNWTYVNVSITETNFANITFELYNVSGGTLVNRTTFTVLTNTINWTNLVNGTYRYNVTLRDLANNVNYSETRTINLTMNSPNVSILYPTDWQNLSSFTVTQFNFSVTDENPLINCSLYGNWTGTWHLNQTILNPQRGSNLNFSPINTGTDGFYKWNVYCYDFLSNFGSNSTNYTFSTFLSTDAPRFFNISQTSKDGKGNITLFWNSSNHSYGYRVYYSSNLTSFILLSENSSSVLNYTDTTFSGNIRRFYRVDSYNPINQNSSTDYFGVHVNTFSHNGNTRNMIGFPTNASYLSTANRTLYDITNATAFTMWNSTLQLRTTCNTFSCPSFPSCTNTNCNFVLSQGLGYEVNINSSAQVPLNWSLVGVVYNRTVLNLNKNSTNFGKNWIALYANTTLANATAVMQNITSSDAISNWNATSQTSQGLIPNPFGSGYLGNNFVLLLEKGYEISVTQNYNWTQ